MSDSGLKSIVSDMYDLRYRTADIALVMQRSERAIRAIRDEVDPRPPKVASIDDLPSYMKERVLLWREQSTSDVPNRQVEATTLTS